MVLLKNYSIELGLFVLVYWILYRPVQYIIGFTQQHVKMEANCLPKRKLKQMTPLKDIHIPKDWPVW